jgi:hypothetical protein
VSYKIKGGKLRKHRASDGGWTRLFDDPCPAAFISRPPRRTLDALKLLPGFTAEVAKRAQSGEPSLCFNEAHDYEFRAVPDVFAVLIAAGDASPIVMGICPECAKQPDAELYSIMRSQFKRFGIGNADDETGHKKVVVEIENVVGIDAIPGVRVAVALSDKSESPYDCEPAQVLIALLRRGALRRFMAFRRGAHNCHAIVDQLYLDFKEIGIAHAFAYKRGSSPLIASSNDPDGLHSWIEADGWVIDASGGAADNPIMVQRIADFYERMKMTNMHEIERQEPTA